MSKIAAAVRNSMVVCAVGVGSFSATVCSAGALVFSDGGDSTPASIQDTVDAFRSALGDPNNGNAAASFASGRREINWDGGGATNGVISGTPLDAFLNGRGARFNTPGTGFIQAPVTGAPTVDFDNINATYATTFSTFSPVRLFSPLGSNVTDAVFFLPGSNGTIAATVGGFGAVFTDIDLANSTRMEFFGTDGSSLFSGFAPVGTVANGSLSFFGVVFDAGERVARVRITTGTTALGPNDNPAGNVDVVVMDDFLFREPVAIPLPSTLALLGIGALGLALRRRSRG